MITKVDQATIDYQEAQMRRNEIKKEMQEISEKLRHWDLANSDHTFGKRYKKRKTALKVAENRSSAYSIDDEIANYPEKYSQQV